MVVMILVMIDDMMNMIMIVLVAVMIDDGDKHDDVDHDYGDWRWR